jgi:hypothetical protein
VKGIDRRNIGMGSSERVALRALLADPDFYRLGISSEAPVTFTRASTMVDPMTGRSLAINAPAVIDQVVEGFLFRHYLVQNARTNQITRSDMTGATLGVVGAASLPTGWSVSADVVNWTPATEIVGLGTENGLPYMDVRVTGTAAGAGNRWDLNTPIPGSDVAAVGEVWTSSWYSRRLAGGSNISSYNVTIHEHTTAGAYNGEGFGVATVDGTLRRSKCTRTLLFATTTKVRTVYRFFTTAAGPIDVTLRVMCPMIEKASFPSSPILTGAAAVTRALDAVTATLPATLPQEAEIVASFIPMDWTGDQDGATGWMLYEGSGFSYPRIIRTSATQVQVNHSDAFGVQSVSVTHGLVSRTQRTFGQAWGAFGNSAYLDGVLVGTDSGSLIPPWNSGFSLRMGDWANATRTSFGYIGMGLKVGGVLTDLQRVAFNRAMKLSLRTFPGVL